MKNAASAQRPEGATDQAVAHLLYVGHLAETVVEMIDPSSSSGTGDLERATCLLHLLQDEASRSLQALGAR